MDEKKPEQVGLSSLVSPELRRRVNQLAAQRTLDTGEYTSASEIVRRALEEYLERNEAR
jgi:Arc/MetJ-type ribon-helix-helix transcriptional regulator